MSMATPDDNFRDRLRVQLIAVAREVLTSQGLGALQARRIARDAQCSVGTLYNIFGDIDGLILAANQLTLADLGQALEEAARGAANRDLKARLMVLANAYLAFAIAHPKAWRAVFEHRLPDGAELPAFYAEDRRRLLALIEAELAASMPDADARLIAAHALFSAVHGIVQLSLDEMLGGFNAAQCERQIRFIIEPFARGLT